AGESPLRRGDLADLERLTHDLLTNSDLSVVAYFDRDGNPLAIASRDPNITPHNLSFLELPANPTQHLMRAVELHTDTLGDFALAMAPVAGAVSMEGDDPLAGYVTVCLNESAEHMHLDRIQAVQMLIGLLTLLCIVPLVSVLVHRIFLPIRELVVA